MSASERWQALESSPEVLTSLAQSLSGGDEGWRVQDVWGLDDELLAMCVDESESEVAALVLLFPSRKGAERRPMDEEDVAKTEGMYFLRQDGRNGRLANACGTIAICHALANAGAVCELPPSSTLGAFVKDTRSNSVEERGALLDASDSVHDVHKALVTSGQSQVLQSSQVQHHFVRYGGVGDGRTEHTASRGVVIRADCEL